MLGPTTRLLVAIRSFHTLVATIQVVVKYRVIFRVMNGYLGLLMGSAISG